MGGRSEEGITSPSGVSLYSLEESGLELSVMERRVSASDSPSRRKSLLPVQATTLHNRKDEC